MLIAVERVAFILLVIVVITTSETISPTPVLNDTSDDLNPVIETTSSLIDVLYSKNTETMSTSTYTSLNLASHPNDSFTVDTTAYNQTENDISDTTANNQTKEDLSDTTIGIVVGVVVSSAVVAGIVGLLAWKIRKQKSQRNPAVPPPKSYLCNDISEKYLNTTKDYTYSNTSKSGLKTMDADTAKDGDAYSNTGPVGYENCSFENEVKDDDGLTYESLGALKLGKDGTSQLSNSSESYTLTRDNLSPSQSILKTERPPQAVKSESYTMLNPDYNEVDGGFYEDLGSDISSSASAGSSLGNRATFPFSSKMNRHASNKEKTEYVNALSLTSTPTNMQTNSQDNAPSALCQTDGEPLPTKGDNKTDSIYFELEKVQDSDEENEGDEEEESITEDHIYEPYSNV